MKPRKKKRKIRPKRRSDQRSEALRRLYAQEMARKKRQADRQHVYRWELGDPPAGICQECQRVAEKLVDGQPPIQHDLPVARGICLQCASLLEADAREIVQAETKS